MYCLIAEYWRADGIVYEPNCLASNKCYLEQLSVITVRLNGNLPKCLIKIIKRLEKNAIINYSVDRRGNFRSLKDNRNKNKKKLSLNPLFIDNYNNVIYYMMYIHKSLTYRKSLWHNYAFYTAISSSTNANPHVTCMMLLVIVLKRIYFNKIIGNLLS